MVRTRTIQPDGLFPVTVTEIEGSQDAQFVLRFWRDYVETGGWLGEIGRWRDEAKDRLVANGLPPDGMVVRGDGGDVLEDAAQFVSELANIGDWQNLEGRQDEVFQRAFIAGMACQRMLARVHESAAIRGKRQLAAAKKGGASRARKKKLTPDQAKVIHIEIAERAQQSVISWSVALARVAKERKVGQSTLRRRFKELNLKRIVCPPARH